MACSLWLAPGGAEAAALAGQVEALARAGEGPLFLPHLTLCSFPGEPPAPALLAGLLSERLPLRLGTAGLAASGEYFRALALEVEPAAELLALRAACLRLASPGDAQAYRPHVSLYYGRRGPGLLARLGGSLALPAQLAFSGAALVFPRQGWEQVGSWEILWLLPPQE
jgi:2'-5' RNA ligase